MISTNDIQNQSITLDKLSPEVVDTLYNTVPVGTVIYSMRTDVPNGFLKADGTEYTRLQYPQFYDMLVANSLPRLTYTDWTTQYATNSGNVGKFGLDETNKKFKMICLTDSFIRNTTTNSNIGVYQTDGLPNLSGGFDGNGDDGAWRKTGVFSQGGTASGANGEAGNGYYIYFNASTYNPIYGRANEVRPKNIQMNAYVCVYNSADDISHMSLSAFAYIDLANITTLPISGTGTSALTASNLVAGTLFTGPDAVTSSWRASDGSSWYRRYKSGWLEQGGFITTIDTSNPQTILFPTGFTNTKYTFLTTAIYNANIYGYHLIESTTTPRTTSSVTVLVSMSRSWSACGY